MIENIKVRWLTDHEQIKVAPKTLSSQVYNENGTLYKDTVNEALESKADKSYVDEQIANIPTESDVFIVTCSGESEMSHTFEEITAAVNNGKAVYASYEGISLMPLSCVSRNDDSTIEFIEFNTIGSEITEDQFGYAWTEGITIFNDNTFYTRYCDLLTQRHPSIESPDGEKDIVANINRLIEKTSNIEEKKEKDLIVTYQSGSTYYATHSVEEIFEAVNNGRTVYFQKDAELLSLLEINTNYATFYIVYLNMQNKLQQKVIALSGNSIILEQDDTYDFAAKSDLNLYCLKTEVDKKIADLVNSAPETLDTLGELATALQENEDVVEVLNEAVGSKADKTEVEDLFNKLNSNLALGFYCVEDVTVITNGVSKVYPANSNVEIKFADTDVFEVIPTSNSSILSLTAFPGALGTFYPWLEGVKQFSNILFNMNDEAMYSKWSQGNQGAYQVQFAQYNNCIFWSDNPYISDVARRTNYTLCATTQLPLCYSTIPENTFKSFYLAFGVNSDPNWSNSLYKESFAQATWATQAFSYYGARVVGYPGHDSPSFNIALPKDCRGLMFDARNIECAGTFDAANCTNFGAKSGSWREAFGDCISLRRLYIKNLKVNLNISWSPIDYDSISYIISAAANTSKITISVSPYTYNLLSQSDFDLATSKNITIALISTNYIEDKRLTAVDDKIKNGSTLINSDELSATLREAQLYTDNAIQNIPVNEQIPTTDQANVQLVTDMNGEVVWEERLGYKTIAEVTFLEESETYPQMADIHMHFGYMNAHEFIVGETYKVNFDGTLYECVATQTEGYGIALGNLSYVDSDIYEDTGEPFGCAHLEPGSTVLFVIPTGTLDSYYTISVVGPAVVIQPIPGDYIAGGLYKGSGDNSFQMKETQANQMEAIALGNRTVANGRASIAMGVDTTTKGPFTIAEGQGTVATIYAQHAQGRYNIEDTEGKYAHIVGNGKREYGVTTASNAYTLDWDGNGWYQGTIETSAVILRSSTPGSTKKFKLTIDDNGVLSTEELSE